ncbi:MAG: CRISPR-associated helicase Cas3' [Cytophaga sp.]|uniref:CRISPR-associated helicase Cas3' n=1 Tax=Cytophaga sp. TaxID=29535 RepID=UPI003F7DB282
MEKLLAKSAPEWTTLQDHLHHVAMSAKAFANHVGLNEDLAYKGAILHDLGKAHPEFQKRLLRSGKSTKTFRHEIASLFFISLFPESEHSALIEMVVGHHKSIKNDAGEKGLLDLDDIEEYENFHLGRWNEWSQHANELLNHFGIYSEFINEKKALENLDYVVDYCKKQIKEKGFSQWRGLLMGADHFASALIHSTEKELKKCFARPNLSFFERTHPLYPLSQMDASSSKKHSLVVACTGAGKTDFLFRRCTGRVFYTLPFQASINAMFKRVAKDLEKDNPDLDIRILHASSSVIKRKGNEEEEVLQSLFGSSVKILTPHQLASIAFGLKGYESLILDLKGCDIILDEIHTYTGVSQAIVIKLVEVLKSIDCKIHVGTATMPSILYNKILSILGDDILEVALPDAELEKFNRHKTFKIKTFEDSFSIINTAIDKNQKVLIVMNRVANAQKVFDELSELYPNIDKILLHSRFKRSDRNKKEKELIGLDDNGIPTNQFNTSNKTCIVVSTQIVEVSLDISFDVMITEAAPLDALAQRFGRINRKRTLDTIGQLKNIYVIAPPEDKQQALPYDLDVLNRTYEVLPDGEIFEEKVLQEKIDIVFPKIDFLNIEEHSVFKTNGDFSINKLTHRSKSILFELLEIDSVSCICESDLVEYENSDFERRLELEIPIRYFTVSKMNQSQKGNKPFIIPDKAYSENMGLITTLIKEENFDFNNQIL